MNPPFDSNKLNALMEEAGVDLVLATSKHNVQYLLGGYHFFIFDHMDAIGISRYLPAVGIPRGRLDGAFYIGNPMEAWQQEDEPLWVGDVRNASWTSRSTAQEAAESMRRLGLSAGTIAVEEAFLPMDAFGALQEELPQAKWVEALPLLEELRIIKAPEELALLKEASEGVVDAMQAAMKSAKAGMTTREIAERMYQEEANRGLSFEYALVCTGRSYVRAPSEARWEKGNILSIDSGGTKRGYMGDLCRMAVMGNATPLMRDLLGEVQAVQAAARSAVRAGIPGGQVFEAALAELAKCPHHDDMGFMAHGIGLVSHEAPHLTGTGMIPYPGTHEKRPLEAGMVLSIETELKSSEVGFVNLEDTVVVTGEGFEALGDDARAWTEVEG